MHITAERERDSDAFWKELKLADRGDMEDVIYHLSHGLDVIFGLPLCGGINA